MPVVTFWANEMGLLCGKSKCMRALSPEEKDMVMLICNHQAHKPDGMLLGDLLIHDKDSFKANLHEPDRYLQDPFLMEINAETGQIQFFLPEKIKPPHWEKVYQRIVHDLRFLKFLEREGYLFAAQLEPSIPNVQLFGAPSIKESRALAHSGFKSYPFPDQTIAAEIIRYHGKYLFHSPSLREYRDRGFQTEEEYRFRWSVRMGLVSLGLSLAVGITTLVWMIAHQCPC
jgi:hypothetical protein